MDGVLTAVRTPHSVLRAARPAATPGDRGCQPGERSWGSAKAVFSCYAVFPSQRSLEHSGDIMLEGIFNPVELR